MNNTTKFDRVRWKTLELKHNGREQNEIEKTKSQFVITNGDVSTILPTRSN